MGLQAAVVQPNLYLLFVDLLQEDQQRNGIKTLKERKKEKVTNVYVKFKKLTKTAQTPTKGSAGAAGYDLYADTVTDIAVYPGETVPFYSGIAVEIPQGYAGFVFSRSGIATKRGLRLPHCVGVIDSDYRGNVGVPMYNDTNDVQVVSPQERIAQLIILPVPYVQLYETMGDLSYTQRGEAGFGSTGR